jgi:carbonic anhydrase
LRFGSARERRAGLGSKETIHPMCEQCDLTRVSRRRLLTAGLVTAAGAALPSLPAWAQSAAPAPNAISPDEAFKRLQQGNARYAANTSTNKDYSAGRVARAKAQYPFASIVSCADSRLAPELAFDQGPGELFVVRVAGNFVNEDGLASLEYGAIVLGVPLIMVLGHSNCGAVNATIKVVKDGTTLPGHLPSLINAIRPAVTAAQAKNPADLLTEATAENVRLNVKSLRSATPILSDLVAGGKLKVVGAVYDIATGKVMPV